MADLRRLRKIVRKCCFLLEEAFRRQIPGCAEQAKDAAKSLFLELAAARCFEETGWQMPVSGDFQAHLLAARQAMTAVCPSLSHFETPLPPFADADALETVRRRLAETIAPEAWRADHLLGWLYQCAEEPQAHKQHGRFYTPEHLAEFIAAQSLAIRRECRPADDIAAFTILDLACGAGAFALQAFDWLYAARRKASPEQPPRSIAARILEEQLFLIDADPLACRLACLSLYLKAKRREPSCRIRRVNVVCADALRRWEREPDAPTALREFFTRRHDAVIGNPPYIVINQLKTPAAQIAAYKSYRSAAYKINTFALFIERGIEWLKTDGVLGMLVPNTFLTQMYFEPLRARILETAAITHILDTKRLFQAAFVENCILLLQRQDDAATRRENVIECRVKRSPQQGVEAINAAQSLEPPHRIPQRHFEQAPFHRFHVSADETTVALMEKIATDAPKLGEICESHDGVNPGNAKRKLITAQPLGDACKKVLNGKNIGRFWTRWDGLYIRYDRGVLSKGDNVRWGHQPSLDGAKILTRQTADRIIGTFDDGGYYVTNSVHTTVLQAGARDFHLKYILGVLNSRLLSFYYRKLIFEAGQVFSQVKLVNLRQLPIKQASREEQREMVALVDALLQANRAAEQAEQRLHALVCGLYRLTPGEIALVEQECFPANPLFTGLSA